jgi:hypothetical protein
MIFVLSHKSLQDNTKSHPNKKKNVSLEMNHGNENNRFPLVCLMENGHNILYAQSNVLKLGLRLGSTCTDQISMTRFTKKYIKYLNFNEKSIFYRFQTMIPKIY